MGGKDAKTDSRGERRKKDGEGKNKFAAGDEGVKGGGESSPKNQASKTMGTGPHLVTGEPWDDYLVLQLQMGYSSSSHHLCLFHPKSLWHSSAVDCPAWMTTVS